MHTYTRARAHSPTHRYIRTRTNTHKHTHTHTRINANVNTQTNTHTHNTHTGSQRSGLAEIPGSASDRAIRFLAHVNGDRNGRIYTSIRTRLDGGRERERGSRGWPGRAGPGWWKRGTLLSSLSTPWRFNIFSSEVDLDAARRRVHPPRLRRSGARRRKRNPIMN